MDQHSSSSHHNHHQPPNNPNYYYSPYHPQQGITHPPANMYITDPPPYSQPAYHQQQQHQQQQHLHPQQQYQHYPAGQERHYAPYNRYSRAPPPPPHMLPAQRPHSHPQHQQSYPQQPLPTQHDQHHEQLRHAHSQPSLPRVSLSASQHYSVYDSSSRTARSSPSESTYSDPMSSLRDDMHGATALAQVAGSSSDVYSITGPAVPRLPPILQVERHQVTTTATQAASANRRRNEAAFMCPVPGCGSTFTRRFNLKGHLRSHTSERPFACDWPGCDKAFARQHDCKRHYQLHSAKAGSHVCKGCGKSFSRMDALNRHLRSDGGVECRAQRRAVGTSRVFADSPSPSEGTDGASASETSAVRSRPPSV